MDLQLKAKTALVTGSTAGIGFAIARALAREGASVVITGRTQERVDDAIENVRRDIREVKISGIAADLATPDGISKCIQAVPTVDVLVNNLGVYEPKPFEQITDNDWRAIVAPLPAADESGQLGAHYFHFQRVRNEHPHRDDSLRRHKDDAGRACARFGRDNGGY